MAERASINFHKLLVRPEDLPSTSVNFSCGCETFRELPSAFDVARRLFVILRQFSECPLDFPSTSVNFRQLLCGPETFRQLPSTVRTARRQSIKLRQFSKQPVDIPSTFYTAGRFSVNSPCRWENFCQISMKPGDLCQLPSTFRATVGPSVNFCQLPMWSGDLPSTSLNCPCGQETIH